MNRDASKSQGVGGNEVFEQNKRKYGTEKGNSGVKPGATSVLH